MFTKFYKYDAVLKFSKNLKDCSISCQNSEVTPNFSTVQNLLKKILSKDKHCQKLLTEKSKYWRKQLKKAFWLIHWP